METRRKTYTIQGKLWRWPGVGGWHFMSLDKKLTPTIREHGKNHAYGSGFIKIQATLGATSWQTALFPYTTEGIYLLSIKAAVRKKEEVTEGDILTVTFTFVYHA